MNEPLSGSRNINKTKIRKRDKPYFHGVENDVMTITLQLFFDDGFDDDSLREVMRWLTTPFYAPLEFSDKPSAMVYAMLVGEPQLIHTGNGQGFIVVNFETDSNTFHSGVQSVNKDFSVNPSGGTNFTLGNSGDEDTPCNVYIDMVDDDDIAITNLTDRGNVININGLKEGMKVLMDGENKDIQCAPRGIFTFSSTPTYNEIVTISNQKYIFSNGTTPTTPTLNEVYVDISGAASVSDVVTILKNAINNNVASEVDAYDESGDSVVVYTKSPEKHGEDFLLSTTCVNANWDDSTMTDIYVHSNWNGNSLLLRFGNNFINFMGKCYAEFKWQNRYLA